LGNDRTSDDFIFKIDLEFVVFVDHRLEEFANVVGVKGRALTGHSRGEVEVTDDFDSVVADDFTFLSKFAVSSIFSCQVHNYTAWLHELDHLFGDKFWSWLSWNKGSCYDNVYLLALLSE